MKRRQKKFLKYNNYYRISGFSLTLRNHDVFYPSVTMQNIMDIYNFDHEFRTIIFDIITKIEINIKSIYAYYFAKEYGATGYLDNRNFYNEEIYNNTINKVNESVKQNVKHEDYMKHFADIVEKLPFWAYIESFTLSDLSKIYSISKLDLKKTIAIEFGLKSNNGYKIMESYLRCLAFLRNICTHGGRLYNRRFNTKPNLSRKEKRLLIKDKNGNPDNSLLYGYIINIKRLAQSIQNKIFSM